MRGTAVGRVWLAVVLVGGGACSGDDDEGRSPPMTQPAAVSGVYFGTVSMTLDRVALALEPPAADGRQRVRAFVSDGEPGGDAEWFDGTVSGNAGNSGNKVSLRAASGRASLEAEVQPEHAHGTIRFPDGRDRAFHTIPATHGAGIYDVTVTADGRFTGQSTDGSRLEARQDGDLVQGTLTTPSGESIGYKVTDISRVLEYTTKGGQPDRYTLVVSRYGLAQVGRGGGDALKAGSPNNNLIALDLAPTPIPTAGVYYGKLAHTTDQLALVVDQPAGQSNRRVQVYLSDGEPEPQGDIEWFAGDVVSDRFNLTSASRNARMTGEVTADSVSGTVTLPDGRPYRFYAVPGGDGAGIYEVTVTADKRYQGTSENGGKLDIRQQGDLVTGTIITAEGRQISLLAYDLTQVFPYGIEGSKPDTYLAFATPGGRYLIGRSGNVRGGTSGNNIIGLDKAC